MTCHKAMSTELFRSLRLKERGFAIEPEIAARVLRAGERIYEVPITYKARSREEGKKLTTLDGLRVSEDARSAAGSTEPHGRPTSIVRAYCRPARRARLLIAAPARSARVDRNPERPSLAPRSPRRLETCAQRVAHGPPRTRQRPLVHGEVPGRRPVPREAGRDLGNRVDDARASAFAGEEGGDEPARLLEVERWQRTDGRQELVHGRPPGVHGCGAEGRGFEGDEPEALVE